MGDRIHAVPAVPIETPNTMGDSSFVEKTFTPIDLEIDPPAGVFSIIRGFPYVLKHFGISENLYQNSPLLKEKLDTIDRFILGIFKEKNYTDSVQTYTAVLGDLKQRLKIPILEKESSIIDKLYSFVKRSRGRSAYKK